MKGIWKIRVFQSSKGLSYRPKRNEERVKRSGVYPFRCAGSHSLTNIIPTAPRGVLSRQALFHSLMGASPSASFNFACHKNPHPWSRRFLSEYAKMGQGIGLQTGCRPSKANNEAASKHILSKTGSDYICQARGVCGTATPWGIRSTPLAGSLRSV